MSTAAFGQAIATWHDFYALTAGAAATLLGLLFVAVSLNLALFTGPTHPRLRAEATVTFTSFLYLVVIALVIVGPDPRPAPLGWFLLSISLVELVGTQRESGWARRLLGTGWRGYLLELVPTICYLGVIVVALGAIVGHPQWLTEHWMIPLVATLLGTATANAWDLLLAVGEAAGTANPTP